MTSVVDFMSQPAIGHEPSDPAEPQAELVDGDCFDRLTKWGAVVEIDRAMGRAYAFVAGRWYATDLDGQVAS